jgi:hypothetical protein
VRALAALVAICALAGCDIEPPAQVRDCLRKETYTALVPKAMAPGHFGPSIGGMRQVRRTKCVEWTPYRDNPAHAEWLKRQATK